MLIVRGRVRTLRIPLNEFDFSFARSSGPGGQNVNKLNTKAVLRWNFEESPCVPPLVKERFRALFGNKLTTSGEVIVTSDRHRDQGRNVADCLEKLRAMLTDAASPPPPRKATKVSRAKKKARVKDKRARSQKKQLRGKVRGEEH